MVMHPEVYGSMALTGFEGGPLRVTIYDQYPSRSVTVTLQGPGGIQVSDMMRGPKEWSPFSQVPKEAVPLLYRNSPSLIIRVVAKYEDLSGITREPEMMIGIRPMTADGTSPRDFCVYFVPAPAPERIKR